MNLMLFSEYQNIGRVLKHYSVKDTYHRENKNIRNLNLSRNRKFLKSRDSNKKVLYYYTAETRERMCRKKIVTRK